MQTGISTPGFRLVSDLPVSQLRPRGGAEQSDEERSEVHARLEQEEQRIAVLVAEYRKTHGHLIKRNKKCASSGLTGGAVVESLENVECLTVIHSEYVIRGETQPNTPRNWKSPRRALSPSSSSDGMNFNDTFDDSGEPKPKSKPKARVRHKQKLVTKTQKRKRATNSGDHTLPIKTSNATRKRRRSKNRCRHCSQFCRAADHLIYCTSCDMQSHLTCVGPVADRSVSRWRCRKCRVGCR